MPSPSPTVRIVPIAPKKIEQIREAGKRQLSPKEYETLEALLRQLIVYGLTPYINTELGKLMAKVDLDLEISESPEWEEALIACDVAFLGSELQDMCNDNNLSPRGHKKELCRRLYHAKVPEIVNIMEPYLVSTAGNVSSETIQE